MVTPKLAADAANKYHHVALQDEVNRIKAAIMRIAEDGGYAMQIALGCSTLGSSDYIVNYFRTLGFKVNVDKPYLTISWIKENAV